MVERKVIGGGGLMVNLRLTNRHVLVIGGGKEAVGRIFFALDADAKVTLIAPYDSCHPEVKARIDRHEVRHLDRHFREPDDLFLDYTFDKETHTAWGSASEDDEEGEGRGGVDLVLGCSDDLAESRRIAISSRAFRIPSTAPTFPNSAISSLSPYIEKVPSKLVFPPMVPALVWQPVSAPTSATHSPKAVEKAVERIGRLRTRVKMVDPDPASSGRRMAWLSRLCDVWSVEEMARIGEDEVIAVLDAYEKGEKIPPPPSSSRPLAAGSIASTPGPSNGTVALITSSEDQGPPQTLISTAKDLAKTAVSTATSATITVSKFAAATTGLAISVALSPITLAAAVASTTASAAASAASSAAVTASRVSGVVHAGATHAADVAGTYGRAVTEASVSTAEGVLAVTGGVVTATVEGGLNILPTHLSRTVKTVMRALLPSFLLPLRGEKRAPICYLVGAGPGDPGLLTVKAAALLGSADVVVSDQLISEHVLNLVPKHRLVLVERKVKGRSDAAQTDANELCLKELRMGKTVVRLKGGDPFMFGRGGEEVLFLRKHGFESVVVPGVSSCIAAPASVGIPVTHRGYADQFLVLSGRGEGGSFPDIPKHNDRRTTVVLMPVARLGALSDAMQEKGYPRDLPAAVVEKGTCLGERVVEGTLGDIAGRIAEANVGSPALFVVGRVCTVLRGDEEGLANGNGVNGSVVRA